MYSFRELQKGKTIEVAGKEQMLAVVSNCSAQFLCDSIQGFARKSELNLRVLDGGYDQIDEQIYDSFSEVYKMKPDYIMLWLCTEKLYEDFLQKGLDERTYYADAILEKLKNYWGRIEKYTDAKILQVNLTEINDYTLGNFSSKVESTFIYQIRKINHFIQECASKNKNVFMVDALSIQIRLGQNVYFNAPLYYTAKMPVAMKALPYLAEATVSVIKAINGIIKKCVVVDLDNTMWGGVLADVGTSNIEIGELGRGRVFSDFQRWLKQLKEYGIILAVCSKNDEEIAKEPFEKNEEMILRLDDIALFVANWNDKASNIRLIQKTLNIGMDSIVFLDDSAFERNLVREKIPEVFVPELPEDPSLWLGELHRLNMFESASIIDEGSQRTKMYQQEFERKKYEEKFESIDDYLSSLGMRGEVHIFEESKYSRIAQLTQRSNQFNLRTVRYTDEDIAKISLNSEYIPLYFSLKDKFGDHGIVAVVIMKRINDVSFFVDTLLMSCRVLKRGMEEYIFNTIVNILKKRNCKTLVGEYIQTNKNMMVKDLYNRMGFESLEDNKFKLEIYRYSEKKTFIEGEDCL